jgi:hypothetical protein
MNEILYIIIHEYFLQFIALRVAMTNNANRSGAERTCPPKRRKVGAQSSVFHFLISLSPDPEP